MNSATGTLSQRERELAAIIAAYNDVTEQLKRSHEGLNHEVSKLRYELEDKNRELARRERLAALGEMATGVAHEIRNPLASIQLFASLLDRDLAALPESQRLVRKISAGVGDLDRIVGDVLDFAGRHDPNPRMVAVLQLVCKAFEALTAQAHGKGVRLESDDSVVGLQAWVDPAQLGRAILNVVLNAIEATPAGGTVKASAEVGDDGSLLLHVADDGPGIAESLAERIFNPFFTTKEMGTGLGLAIAHRILECHGGRISASNRPQRGARFTLQLPRTAPPRACSESAKEHGHGPYLRGR